MSPQASLPSMELEFEVNVVGDTTGERYAGSFKYKRPNLGLIRQIRTTRAHLNEDLVNLDDETKLLNEMVSWLSYTIVDSPKWWNNNGWDLYDYNVVLAVYDKVLEYEKSFRKKIEDIGEDGDENKSPKGRRK